MASVVEPVSAALGDPSLLPWILGAWALSSVASFAVAGQLSDVFGRRPLVLAGEALVTLGCIVASAAQDMPTLISGETIIGFANGPLFVAYAGVPEMLPNRWRLVGLALLEAGVELPW